MRVSVASMFLSSNVAVRASVVFAETAEEVIEKVADFEPSGMVTVVG